MIVELLGREAGLTFECMHIVPGKGDCSRIHPHFHYIDVSVDGEFDDKRRVVHLYNLKAIINRLCLTFEDKILLADYPETIQKIIDKETHYHIEINNKYYLIPKSDIFRINIPSLNIEDIAVYCIDQLIIDIKNDDAFSSLNYIEVVLSEGHGQRGKIKKNLK